MRVPNVFTRKRLQFTALEFMFWATFAATPFTVVFLREHGLKTTTIGLILSINSIIGIFAQPIWGLISDKLKSIKKVFMFCFAMCSITYFFLPFMHATILLGILLSLDTFFRSSVVALMDTWVVSSIAYEEKVKISYGSLRLWGSIGFAIMVLLYGRIIDHSSINIIFPIYFVIAVITLVICLFIENSSASLHMNYKELKPKRLFKNYYYVVFVVFIFLLSIPNSPSGTFLPNLFDQVGGTKEQYGLMHSLKAFMEIPIFLFGKTLLDKFGHKKLIVLAALLYTLQQILFANATSPFQVIFAQVIQGPAYSLFLLGMLYYIFELAPEGLKATAQTMASALGMSLSSIVGNYGGGIFIDHFGLKPMFRLGAISDSITIALFIFSFIIGKTLLKKKISMKE